MFEQRANMSVSELASSPAPREPIIPAPLRFSFACPVCRGPLAAIAPDQQCCPIDNISYYRVDGIWRFLETDWATNLGQSGTPRLKVGKIVHINTFNLLFGDGHAVRDDQTDQDNWVAAIDP